MNCKAAAILGAGTRDGGGLKTILLDGTDDPASSSNLPDITEAVTINGYTQPWASPNTNTDLAQGTNAAGNTSEFSRGFEVP